MKNLNKIQEEKDSPIEVRPEALYDYLYEHLLFDKGYAKLVIKWGNKVPKNKQIITLKKICPDLKMLSIVELFNLIKDKEIEWEFTEMGCGEAIDFVEIAKKLGLEIEMRQNVSNNY